MDTRDECGRSGTIWQFVQLYREQWYIQEAVFVGEMEQSSGRVISGGFLIGKLNISALGRRKCPVNPDSQIPWPIGIKNFLFITLLQTIYLQLKCTTVLSPSSILGTDYFVDLCTTVIWVGVCMGLVVYIHWFHMFVPCCPKESGVLNRVSRLSRYNGYLSLTNTGTREEVIFGPSYSWIIIWFVHFAWIDSAK